MVALRFVGKVAIVTGAGGGLGRTYALDLAKRGCKVVVNDLGGDRHGTSSSTSMADKVVGEIRAAGGTAVPDYNSVENGDKLVKTAIDNFGRIDIVINNAGILRDVSMLKMTDMDWDLIFRVHVKGAYAVTKAAWPYMRDQGYGRIVVTSSNSAIYGNFGQANYSAAKHALIGLANTLALEGEKYNIKVNTLVPTAGSRLTQTSMPEEIVEALKPEYVTPLVTFMVHDSFKESGHVFEAGAQWFGEYKYYRSEGKRLTGATAETIADNWKSITDFRKAKNFESIKEHGMELFSNLDSSDESPVQAANVIGASPSGFPKSIKSSALFEEIAEGIKADPKSVEKIKQIFLYVITDGSKELGKFTLDFKSSPPKVYFGDVKSGSPAVTVTVSDQVFLDLAAGKENPQKAFMAGKIKAKGNIMLLQKLQGILDAKRKAKL